MIPRARLYLAGAGLLVSALGCSAWLPDLVEQHQFRAPAPLRKLAVAPFEASPRPSNRALGSGVEVSEAAVLVSRFVTEALEARGLEVIPPHDLQVAFEADGREMPLQSPMALAGLAHEEFGAQAILLGVLRRWRARQGSAYGSVAPASLEFEVTLYSAPGAEKLWTARFDQTQSSLTENPLTSARYPSGGARFLTTAELARWGASLVAAELPVGH